MSSNGSSASSLLQRLQKFSGVVAYQPVYDHQGHLDTSVNGQLLHNAHGPSVIPQRHAVTFTSNASPHGLKDVKNKTLERFPALASDSNRIRIFKVGDFAAMVLELHDLPAGELPRSHQHRRREEDHEGKKPGLEDVLK